LERLSAALAGKLPDCAVPGHVRVRENQAHERRVRDIDGEVVVPAADGTTDFAVLQNELRGSSDKIVLVAFDLLYLNGRDLRGLPLHERKMHLKKLIAGTAIQYSENFEIDGKEMFRHVSKLGYEGVEG